MRLILSRPKHRGSSPDFPIPSLVTGTHESSKCSRGSEGSREPYDAAWLSGWVQPASLGISKAKEPCPEKALVVWTLPMCASSSSFLVRLLSFGSLPFFGRQQSGGRERWDCPRVGAVGASSPSPALGSGRSGCPRPGPLPPRGWQTLPALLLSPSHTCKGREVTNKAGSECLWELPGSRVLVQQFLVF